MSMNSDIGLLAEKLGIEWQDHQLEALEYAWKFGPDALRMLLFYKTGAGKTFTGLGCVVLEGWSEITVVAPPSTHPAWHNAGLACGVKVITLSHAKFRMKDYLHSRYMPLIVDEFHLLGGHKGKGWLKLDRMARGLEAPLILMSATPNYNDAERVYCIQHVLDPNSVKGGYIEFLYKHCETEQNPFGQEPKVTGFKEYGSAADYLAALPYTQYLEDDLVYQIQDFEVSRLSPAELVEWGYNRRRHKMIASIIEERHALVFQGLVGEDGLIRDHIYETLSDLRSTAAGPVLVYANHSTVAEALHRSLTKDGVQCTIVTGDTAPRLKDVRIRDFIVGEYEVLVGTASLATGTDGMDKMCDHLVILDDTDDAALRRQLIGRIMPRGLDTDATGKHVWRVVLQ